LALLVPLLKTFGDHTNFGIVIDFAGDCVEMSGNPRGWPVLLVPPLFSVRAASKINAGIPPGRSKSGITGIRDRMAPNPPFPDSGILPETYDDERTQMKGRQPL
jgi:hypothetical protein